MAVSKTRLKQDREKLTTILIRGNGKVYVGGQALNQDQIRGMILGFEVVLGLDNSLSFDFDEGAEPLRKKKKTDTKKRKKRTPAKFNSGSPSSTSPKPSTSSSAPSPSTSDKDAVAASNSSRPPLPKEEVILPGPPPEIDISSGEDSDEWEADWD